MGKKWSKHTDKDWNNESAEVYRTRKVSLKVKANKYELELKKKLVDDYCQTYDLLGIARAEIEIRRGKIVLVSADNIVSLVVPEFIDKIDEGALRYNKVIRTIEMGDGVTDIGDCAFYFCDNLESIKLSKNITKIESNLFTGCTSLKSLTIPLNVYSIESGALWGCKGLESIEVPNNVTYIGEGAFWNCKGLESITLPEIFKGREKELGLESEVYVKFV